MAKIDFNENDATKVSLDLPEGRVSPARIFEGLYHAVAHQLGDDDLRRIAGMSEDADCQSVNLEHTFEQLANEFSQYKGNTLNGYDVDKLLWGASSAMANIRAMHAIANDAEFILAERVAKNG